ncbi:MAG: hypothetical protein WBX15_20080 [Thermoanaerobaculia bacterium]
MATSSTNAWTKTYLDEGTLANFTDSGQQRSRTFTVADQSKRTVIVLAWSDFASAPGNASPLLTRDLDLEVYFGNCATYWGNYINPSTEQSYATCIMPSPESTNNVELVVVPPYSGSSFTVYVHSKDLGASRPWLPGYLTDASQPFAIFALNTY